MSSLKPADVPTKLPGGIERIIQVCEDLRERNSDGYLRGGEGGGILANIRDHRSLRISKGTTCTPFTATVIGVAFDPGYPRRDLPFPGGDPYVPLYNGGKDPLMPYADFHLEHNANNNAVKSIEKYGLGREIAPGKMRRGDMVEIGWYKGLGHGVFCWDVHLDGDGEVDCFQFLGANGGAGLPGVTISGCHGPRWLTGKSAYGVRDTGSLKKAAARIFVDDDEIVAAGQWLVLPGVPKDSIRLDTFRVRPRHMVYSGPMFNGGWSAETIRCARFHYDGDPPASYCMNNGAAPAKVPAAVGHLDAPAIIVRGNGVRSDPEAPKKAPPKPAKQDKDRPTDWQHFVESALQVFYQARWIESDPGKPDNINDAKSQAAVKEFQQKFKLDVDGIAGKYTLAALRKQLPACAQHVIAQFLMGRLYQGKKITHDPGYPDGVNNPQMRAAVEEFQKKNGLDAIGIPDADTLARIIQACQEHEPTSAQHGLQPALHHLYWVGNIVEPCGSGTLRLHFRDLVVGQECPIYLKDEVSGKEVVASLKLRVERAEAEEAVTIPPDFGAGARVQARVTADISDGGEMDAMTAAPLYVRGTPKDSIAVVDGDDVYLDPPVRLWPQYDGRWKNERIGGPRASRLINWRDNGCNASTAAMILRWFAEDCRAGKIPYPTKPGGSIDPSWYGLRMGEAFWPGADPPGKVDLTSEGRIHFRKIYAIAAHYLKTGEIQRNEKGEALDPSGAKAYYVTRPPAKGWLALIEDLLRTGPVIVGLGAPAAHFVLAQGIVGGALLIVDPGGVLYQASKGLSKEIANWQGKEGYLDGTTDPDKVRMPAPSQWPEGKAPGQEGDRRSYNRISGQFLKDLLDHLISVTSLTYPEGAEFPFGAAP